MAKQKYIPLFDDQLEVISFLSDEQLGGAVRAAMQYMRSGEETVLEGVAGMFYHVFFLCFFGDLAALRRFETVAWFFLSMAAISLTLKPRS